MDALLTELSRLIVDSTWLAPFIAFLAGVITSFSPCSISSVPLIVGYVGGANITGAQNTKRAFMLSVIFALGSALTFTIFGIMASLAGELVGTAAQWWYMALGTLMMLMVLQMLGIYQFIPSINLSAKNKSKGMVGAFVAGILGGLFASPCSTPVLIALIALVAEQGNLVFGIVLFLFYSLGHGILAVMAGTSVGLVQKLSQDSRYAALSKALTTGLAIILLGIGFYMFHLAFQM